MCRKGRRPTRSLPAEGTPASKRAAPVVLNPLSISRYTAICPLSRTLPLGLRCVGARPSAKPPRPVGASEGKAEGVQCDLIAAFQGSGWGIAFSGGEPVVQRVCWDLRRR